MAKKDLPQKSWGDIEALPQELVCLGFDCGSRSTGVAVGQSITQSASPLPALKVKRYQPNWSDIEALLMQWQPHMCIVGWPLGLHGKPQAVTKHAEKFAKQLHLVSQCVVIMVDERYSSTTARQEIFDAQGHRGLRKEKVDSYVAKLLIEQWFDQCERR